MKPIVCCGISLAFSGCLLPDWVNPAVKQSFEESYRHGFQQQSLATEELVYDGDGEGGRIDIFSHYSVGRGSGSYGAYMGIHVREFDLSTFMRAVVEFPCSDNKFFGADEIRVFWVNRRSWYFPTKEEMLGARACVIQAYIRLLEMPEGSNEGQQFALGMSELARVVFANVAEIGLRTTAINRPDLDSRPGIVNFFRSRPDLVALVNRMAEIAPEAEDAYLQAGIDLLMSKPLDPVGMIHVSDFLDHHGHTPCSMKLWKALISQGDDRLLMEQVRNSVYITKHAEHAHRQRITYYNRGMGAAASEWNQNTGWLMRYLWNRTGNAGKDVMRACMPSNYPERADMELATAFDTKQLFYHLEDNGDKIIPMYKCIISEIIDKQGELRFPLTGDIDEELVSVFPVLLHTIKISYDGLALILDL
jgi:hypothetical protein